MLTQDISKLKFTAMSDDMKQGAVSMLYEKYAEMLRNPNISPNDKIQVQSKMLGFSDSGDLISFVLGKITGLFA